MVYQDYIAIATQPDGGMTDLTDAVNRIIRASGIQAGIAHAFNIGSTAAISTVEFEPGLQKDVPSTMHRLMPPSREYGHEQTWHDGNGHSHLQATTLGPSLTVPVRNGRAELGTW